MTKIMIIDDSQAILNIVKHIISHEATVDAELTLFSKATLAKSAFVNLKPDLVITDITMPEINGYDLIEYMKVELDVPIIAMSGSTYNDNDTSTILYCAEKIGADYCILKDELVSKLAKLIDMILMPEMIEQT